MRRHSISRTNAVIEPVDEWLESLSLFRKQVPRDGSCLFRAVAEQVCLSQSYHEQLRHLALDYMLLHKTFFQAYLSQPLENYVQKMRNPLECGDKLELMALALIFKNDFLVFSEIGASATSVTGFEFPQKIMLYKNGGNHFDIVYKKRHAVVTGFCQAIVYEMLYSKVFKMTDVMNIVDEMLHDTNSYFRKDSMNSEGQEIDIIRIVEQVESIKTSEDILNNSMDCTTPEKGLNPPFPYRVAKALDPDVYRNSDYDIWIAIKREARFGPYDSKGLQIGVKVIVRANLLNKNGKESRDALPSKDDKIFHGHIQSMTENQGPVEVFVEELGRRITVSYHCLEKVSVTPTRSSFEESYIGSPPTYKILSEITRKVPLPIPDHHNFLVHGKGKRKGVFPLPLPSSIQASRNKSMAMQREPNGIPSPNIKMNSPGHTGESSTPVKEKIWSVESSSPIAVDTGGTHLISGLQVYDYFNDSINFEEVPQPIAAVVGSPVQQMVPPFCTDAGCTGQCGINMFSWAPYSEVFGFPVENYPYNAVSYFVPYVPSPYFYGTSPSFDYTAPIQNPSHYVPVYSANSNEPNQELLVASPVSGGAPVYYPPLPLSSVPACAMDNNCDELFALGPV